MMQIHRNNITFAGLLSMMGSIFLLSVLLTTVAPIEQRWSGCDVVLAYSIPALCLLVAGCMTMFREMRLSVSLLDCLVLSWGLYFFLRTYVGAEYSCATQVLKTAELFMFYFAIRGISHICRVPSIVIVMGILACCTYETLYGISQIVNGTSRHCLYVATGSFFNPGPYSAYMMMGLVAAAVVKTQEWNVPHPQVRRVANVAFWAFVAVNSFMLLVTLSRAALLSLVLVLMWIYRERYRKWRWLVWTLFSCVAIVGYIMKQGSADGRLLTWMASVTSWAHAPWFGVGVGGFRHACGEGVAEMYAVSPHNMLFTSGDVAEYSFSDILKILVEQGAVGAAFCIAVVLSALYNIRKCSNPLFYAIVSLLIFSLFSYPFELYPYKVLAVVVFAAVPHKCPVADFRGWGKAVVLVLTGIVAASVSLFSANQIRQRHDADKAVARFAHIRHETFLKDFWQYLPLEGDNPHFLFNFAKTLRTFGRYTDSNAVLRQGSSISNDPMFYMVQGNNYMDMNHPYLAEQAYLKAHAVMPNRLYPLYRLMLLYGETGQTEKMRRMAKRIVASKPKIVSPATTDMINKAKRCL